ncbi:hypothetical protein ABT56_17630 [Photobacterium aquae]|uniref:Zinc-dependent peptidase n=1 Tax=Photobacterium aquae TaxID=1195763 RepID=A0A0J1GWK3_9GAMM|nr:zinc-dependent peptidase [Photobacterium aquae]KLV03794.1 hypothetical protein ABT56_17630 [Photobacterium aquae]
MFFGFGKRKEKGRAAPRFENVHAILCRSMALYPYFSDQQQQVICQFVNGFYDGKTVLVSPEIEVEDHETLLVVIAANAALVGAAQQTNFFSSVKWLHICADDLPVDGDAYESSTVRLCAWPCLEESFEILEGHNLVVHEFAHVLDHLFGLSGSTPALCAGYENYLDNIEKQQDDAIADCATPPGERGDTLYGYDDASFHPPEEYFAVLSELFFTNPSAILNDSPELYRDLVAIYGLDMASHLRDTNA